MPLIPFTKNFISLMAWNPIH